MPPNIISLEFYTVNTGSQGWDDKGDGEVVRRLTTHQNPNAHPGGGRDVVV